MHHSHPQYHTALYKWSLILCCPPRTWGIGRGQIFDTFPHTSGKPKENPVLWNLLDCHYYCILWHVNRIVFLYNLLQGSEKFCSSSYFLLKFIKRVSSLNWSGLCRDSLDKIWNNIFHFLKRPDFHIISRVRYFQKQNLALEYFHLL